MKVEIDEGTLPDISLFDFEKKKFVKDVTNKIVTIIKEKLPKQELFSKCIVKFDYLFTHKDVILDEGKRLILELATDSMVELNETPLIVTLDLYTINLNYYEFYKKYYNANDGKLHNVFHYEEDYNGWKIIMNVDTMYIDFVGLSEDDKLSIFQFVNAPDKEVANTLFPLTKDNKFIRASHHHCVDTDWIRENDKHFYEKYKLLFD